ncbi:hypothetical protein CAPTEDRAFT_210700 [Capitella teleta]|uniref:Uncharacterized protein n=1 Tax=Capitella teleta TaxID=283909 RepID=R7U933_CAPTE|nr:hypothetical protein CAPTEDRAFT_210700 [Capitella teleta]|eukprot:ELU02865.1 hypothetical protein CAPTEDRAFT_210700 [Capitella teleta]
MAIRTYDWEVLFTCEITIARISSLCAIIMEITNPFLLRHGTPVECWNWDAQPEDAVAMGNAQFTPVQPPNPAPRRIIHPSHIPRAERSLIPAQVMIGEASKDGSPHQFAMALQDSAEPQNPREQEATLYTGRSAAAAQQRVTPLRQSVHLDALSHKQVEIPSLSIDSSTIQPLPIPRTQPVQQPLLQPEPGVECTQRNESEVITGQELHALLTAELRKEFDEDALPYSLLSPPVEAEGPAQISYLLCAIHCRLELAELKHRVLGGRLREFFIKKEAELKQSRANSLANGCDPHGVTCYFDFHLIDLINKISARVDLLDNLVKRERRAPGLIAQHQGFKVPKVPRVRKHRPSFLATVRHR